MQIENSQTRRHRKESLATEDTEFTESKSISKNSLSVPISVSSVPSVAKHEWWCLSRYYVVARWL